MPIGSSKLGVLGGKPIVPGGCQTFNSPGTFVVPCGVSILNVVGKGAPGNPGGPGNSSTRGAGGAGGKGGSLPQLNNPCGPANQGKPGGNGRPGLAGNTGSPGNVGTASTAFSLNFAGGAAGNGGAGGPAGPSGANGAAANNVPSNSNGPGAINPCGPSLGGRGAAGSGNSFYAPFNCSFEKQGRGGGGGGGQKSGPGSGPSPYVCPTYKAQSVNGSASTDGQSAAAVSFENSIPNQNKGRGGDGSCAPTFSSINAADPGFPAVSYNGFGGPTMSVAGGGGGGGAAANTGKGAGGGAGGVAASAGQFCGSAGNPGSTANPTTSNCISVTPGASYPISVASPGGQILISWNPQ